MVLGAMTSDDDYPAPDWGVWRREPDEDGPGGEG